MKLYCIRSSFILGHSFYRTLNSKSDSCFVLVIVYIMNICMYAIKLFVMIILIIIIYQWREPVCKPFITNQQHVEASRFGRRDVFLLLASRALQVLRERLVFNYLSNQA